MEHVVAVLCLSVCVLVSETDGNMDAGERNLLQFRQMITCVLPDSSPLEDFGDYGCYCGLGGEGTPVDELDQCCFVHDNCYSLAKNLEDCSSPLDSPYTNTYKFKCDQSLNIVTCLDSNSACNMFICECDRMASKCFEVTPYNTSNNHLPSSMCKSGSRASGSSTLTTLILTLLSSITLSLISPA